MSAFGDWVQLGKVRIQIVATPAAVACQWIANPENFSATSALHLIIGLTLASFFCNLAS